jgi:hypothetical protein
MNIFESLRSDHVIQRDLATRLIKTHGDSDARKRLFQELKLEMMSHEKAEERYFYIPLLESDLTQEKARHSISEHHELDEFIEDLQAMDFSASSWLVTAKKLEARLHHHLDEEEHEIFQLAGKALSEKAKVSLGQEYRKLMEEERVD